MFTERRRYILIFEVLLALTTLAFSGLGRTQLCCWDWPAICQCICGSGSDHPAQSASDEMSSAYQPGVVERWHDMDVPTGSYPLRAKDLIFLRQWLPGNVIIGLQVPTAPGAREPGTAYDADIWLTVARQSGNAIIAEVPLSSHDDLAARIAQVFPPEPGSHWQALVAANNDYLALIPTTDETFMGASGYLHYELDFHGADFCNGCVVPCTVCTPEQLPPDLRLAAKLLPNGLRFYSAGGLTCVDLIPTVIHISPDGGTPPPAQPAAWFSAWGGPVLTAAYSPVVELEYTLGHNLAQRQTFNLEPIHSERGWSYQWRNLSGQPITQLVVDRTPTGEEGWKSNVKIVGTMPSTCTLALDTIHITATSVTSPSLRAVNVSHVQVVPDPRRCLLVDLGISKTSDRSTITSGEVVTFTLTITNYGESPADVVVTDTLDPGWAIADATLPAGCTRNGGQITCRVSALPPNAPRTLAIGVRVFPTFFGTLTNEAQIAGVQGTDIALYDNYAGPVTVTVEPAQIKLFLPALLKR